MLCSVMRDGTELFADVLLPGGSGPRPVLIESKLRDVDACGKSRIVTDGIMQVKTKGEEILLRKIDMN